MLKKLYEPRLRSGSKRRIHFLPGTNGRVEMNGINVAGPLSNGLLEIRRGILAGDKLHEDFYRIHNGRSDTLLMTLGIMHLHLAPGSNALLFLIQYEDHTTYIEINDHSPFAYDPNAVAYFQVNYLQQIYRHEQEYARMIKQVEKDRNAAISRFKAGLKKPETDPDR